MLEREVLLMGRVLWVIGLVGACSGAEQQAGPGSARGQDLETGTLDAEAERARQRLIKDELGRSEQRELVFSARSLPSPEQQLLGKLLDAARLVDELRLLQTSRKALEQRAEVERSGTADDRELFDRNAGPWCVENDDLRCYALRGQAPRPRGSSAWPDDLTPAERQRLSADPGLLNPLTLVLRDGHGFRAVPLAADPLFGPRLKSLAQRLDEAAALAAEPTLARYLRGVANALVAARQEALWQSQLDWIALRGRVEVMVGPYQAPGAPELVKPQLGMLIGVEDDSRTETLRLYLEQLAPLQASLPRLASSYRPPAQRPAALRIVQLLDAAGSARLRSGILASLERSVASQRGGPGQGRRLLFSNHLRVQGTILEAQARATLADEPAGLVTAEDAVLQALWREVCRGLAPGADLVIETKQGPAPLARALAGLWPLFEQLHAELLPLWALVESRQRLKLDEAALHARCAGTVARWAALAQQEPGLTSTQAAGVLLGLLLEGMILVEGEDGRLALNAQRLRGSLPRLTSRLLGAALGGDRASAEKLVSAHLSLGGRAPRFGERVERLRARARRAFAAAGIKPVTLRYRVTDLRRPSPGAPGVRGPRP